MDGSVAAAVAMLERSNFNQNPYVDWVFQRCGHRVPSADACIVNGHSSKRRLVPHSTEFTSPPDIIIMSRQIGQSDYDRFHNPVIFFHASYDEMPEYS